MLAAIFFDILWPFNVPCPYINTIHIMQTYKLHISDGGAVTAKWANDHDSSFLYGNGKHSTDSELFTVWSLYKWQNMQRDTC